MSDLEMWKILARRYLDGWQKNAGLVLRFTKSRNRTAYRLRRMRKYIRLLRAVINSVDVCNIGGPEICRKNYRIDRITLAEFDNEKHVGCTRCGHKVCVC